VGPNPRPTAYHAEGHEGGKDLSTLSKDFQSCFNGLNG
jgi:hypothetical protein